MDTRIEELIAIGASVTANCQPCLQYHVRMARENGAGQQDILEAIAMGKKVRHGARHKMDEYTDVLLREAPEGAISECGECGCD